MNEVNVGICKVKGAEDLPFPRYMTELAAGMDLVANVNKDTILLPGEFKLIPSGIKIELPEGYEAQIRPRSGLAAKYGVTVLNSPGTIDADFRGEIKVLLINHGDEEFIIKRGERIAQIVISNVVKANLYEKTRLNMTQRNQGGFGHTGI